MKTPTPNQEDEWIKWNGKASDTVRFASIAQKKSAITNSQALIKKSEIEKMRAARNQAAKASEQETTSNTQRIDVCFDSLWRQCT